MNEPTADRDPFEVVADLFLARFRAGERPSIEEYATRYPELADQIRELLPALVMVEQDLTIERDTGRRDAHLTAPGQLSQLGDYRILREVGRGGMGVVYEAEQVSLGRRVALKVLPDHVSRDWLVQERFRREARAAARLHHTNIVPVFEVGQEGDVCFYAMQFIQGQGLDAVIDELRRLRDRSRPQSSDTAVIEKSASRSRAAWDRPEFDRPVPRQRPKVSPLVQSILSGQFDRHGECQSPSASQESTLADTRTIGQTMAAEDCSTIAARESDLVRSQSEALRTTRRGQAEPARPKEPAPLSPSPQPSSAVSTLLPGGAQLSSVETGRGVYYRSLAQIGRQVAGGLEYAHARGIVHRDIKPSNLLLDTEGVVWIADFGLAKGEEEGLTQSGDILGTLRYMAPCRFRGEGDARSDVYSLGMTLYELLTLRPAFESADRLKLIEQIKSQDPPRPRTIDERIPRDLETIVLKAIEKEPRARYQSAREMGEDLRRFLADEPIKARQVRLPERYWRWARRNPVIAVLGGVLTALLVAIAVVSTVAASHLSFANQRSQLDRKDAIQARRQAVAERDRSRQLSANLALDKGLTLAGEGKADRGLHWMLQALKTAPENAKAFQRVVRWNLGAWLGQVHKPLGIYETGPSYYLAFSPDGKSFATSHFPTDREGATPIDLWDTASGEKLSGLANAFGSFAFRPDGRVLVASTNDWKHVAAFDLETKQALWTSPELPGEPGFEVWYKADGASLYVERSSGSATDYYFGLPGKSIIALDPSTGRPRGEPIYGRGWIALAPGESHAATGRVFNDELHIDLLELPSGRRTSSWRAEGNGLSWMAFSSDGKALFGSLKVGDPTDPKGFFGQIWDTGTGRAKTPLISGSTWPVYSPAGDRLVLESDYLKEVGEADDMRQRGCRSPLSGPMAMHPDGRTAITAHPDGTVRLWQISADAEPVANQAVAPMPSLRGDEVKRKPRGYAVIRGGLLSPDARLAASLVEGAEGREWIRFLDPATGRPTSRPAPHQVGWVIRSAAFSPDGQCFATGSNPLHRVASELRLWNTNTGRLLLPPIPLTNHVSAIAFHPDDQIVATGDYNGLVRFWDTTSGHELGRPLALGEIVLSLCYSPDGSILAVGLSDDHTGKPGARLWNTATHEPVGKLLPHSGRVYNLAFRPDGRALSVGDKLAFRLWDSTSGEALSDTIRDEMPGGFLPDGRAFLTLGMNGTVKLRDAASGAVLTALLATSSEAICAAIRGDGGLVAVGFDDGSVRLCDLATNQPVGPARFMRSAVQLVAFTADGRSVAAIDEEGETRTWPIPKPLEDESLGDLTLRIEAHTGLRMETGLGLTGLDSTTWSERLVRLRKLDPAALSLDDGPAWHEPMLLEAEQEDNTFAAIWHLDRLIATRPGDWFLYARRARAWALSDQFEKAGADYQMAERLSSREQVLDFQYHCAIESAEAGRWIEALWNLDHLIATRLDDASLHELRAAVYGKLGRDADGQAEMARVFELGADEGLVIPRAKELGLAGRWAEAADLLARCGRAGPISQELAQAWGIACVSVGDRAGYREACAVDLAHQGAEPTVVWNALSAASLFALGASGLDEYALPIGWFETKLSATPEPRPLLRRYYSNALGGLLLRAGRFDESITRINEGIAAAKEIELPSDWAYLAMAHALKGDRAEAQKWLDRLPAIQPDPSGAFWDQQELYLLRKEAESLLPDASFPTDPFAGR